MSWLEYPKFAYQLLFDAHTMNDDSSGNSLMQKISKAAEFVKSALTYSATDTPQKSVVIASVNPEKDPVPVPESHYYGCDQKTYFNNTNIQYPLLMQSSDSTMSPVVLCTTCGIPKETFPCPKCNSKYVYCEQCLIHFAHRTR